MLANTIKKEYLSPGFWKNALWGTPTRKRLSGNFFSLSILQAAKYLLPLLTLPYLVRVLGPANYGLVAFAQAFIGYFIIFTDYGFNLSATRLISINRDNEKEIEKIFSSVIAAKLILGFISFIILLFILFFIPKFNKDLFVYIFSFGMVLGNILFPVWFFQGMERMKYITILDISAKTFFTILIFFFVKETSDYIYVPLFNSLGYVTVGIISLILILKNFKIKPFLPSFIQIKEQFYEGWHIFISTAAISLYTTSNSFILGLFAGNVAVGYYSAAEKIVLAFQGLLAPLSQSIYPFFSKKFIENKARAAAILKIVLLIIGGGTLIISILVSLLSPIIVKVVLGNSYENSIPVLRILAFVVFAVGVNNILGIQGLLAYGHKEQFFRIVFLCGLVHIAMMAFLIPLVGITGVAIAVIVTESLIAFFEFRFLKKKEIL